MRHPAVQAAAVVGILDEGLVKPKAFVVLRSGETRPRDVVEGELKDHVRSLLSKHKYPRVIEFVDDLPKNDRGKVDKKALRERQSLPPLPETERSPS
jgi:acyl-coenzyme A synthetase/AMP-(fatty) acid ligase